MKVLDHIAKKTPDKLGKYEIYKVLGRGSMAVVFLGYDPYANRQVAIKVAQPKFFEDKKRGQVFKKMFFNEARIVGMLDHKNILSTYDADVEGDLLYIVMENIRGGKTLKEFSSSDNLLPVPDVLTILYKCCKALDYAHARGVIHRDIKPSNILLTDEMDVRIADFGIAQSIKSDSTQLAGVMGTPRYMSPEQINDEILTNQTDIYSLGIVMYELLTGRTPFEAVNYPALFKKILNDERPPMKKFRPDIPEELERIVLLALAKDPDKRYPKGIDFAADLSLALKQKLAVDVKTAEERTKEDRFRSIRKNRFFKDFFESELREVAEICEWGEFRAGDLIINEGDLDYSFYIILDGNVEVRKNERVISSLSAGDCFGEMAYLSKAKRMANIAAVSDVTSIKIDNTLMEKASNSCQLKFMKKFVQTLIDRLFFASSKLSQDE